jgi:hypothetical protein
VHQWTLYADRLEARRHGPLQERLSQLDLDQVEMVHFVQEPPQFLVGAAAGAAAVLAMALGAGLAGAVGMAAVFAVSAVTGFLATAAWIGKVPWLVVETAGGGRLRIRGDLPEPGEVRRFGERLRTASLETRRALAEDPGLTAPWEDQSAEDEGIDPRWIN